MKALKKLLIACIFFYTPFYSMAWGPTGHRVTGQIAESYLTEKARINIRKILGNESIAMASNWADFIKSDSNYNYISPWHYINLPDSLNYSQLKTSLMNDTNADAYTKVNFLIKELKNKSLPKKTKLMDLRLLIHIVEDIHQPMHVSREEDQGGNKIKVLWFNNPSNLHRVWDEDLIQYQQLSYTEYANAINYTTRTQRSSWQHDPVAKWFYESHEISLQLYNEIKQPDQKLSYRYNFDHIATLNQQLVKGGVRLAGILNQIFG